MGVLWNNVQNFNAYDWIGIDHCKYVIYIQQHNGVSNNQQPDNYFQMAIELQRLAVSGEPLASATPTTPDELI